MNIHVTIIEDEERFAQDLTEKIRNWFHAHHMEVAVKWYPSSHHIFSPAVTLQPMYIFWISR